MSYVFNEGDALRRRIPPHICREPEGPVRCRSYVLALISDGDVGLFFAQVKDQLLGLVCVTIRQSPVVPIIAPRRDAVIDNIVVRPGFRRAGIGRALMERAQEWAATGGAGTVELNVWEFNTRATEFYHQFGYRPVSRDMRMQLS
jgi:GNAT superfamily N-acetyltransferase